MFTGIVQQLGMIRVSEASNAGIQIKIAPIPEQWNAGAGDSIAVNGVCLTLLDDVQENLGSFTVGPETLAITGTQRWQQGHRVNLEPALRVGDALGGHQVSGHVDATVEIQSIQKVGDYSDEGLEVWLAIPFELHPYCMHKGSITIDGISLTINEVRTQLQKQICQIRINLIPHTIAQTNAQFWVKADALHCEIDRQTAAIVDTVRSYLESQHISERKDAL